MKNTNLKIGLWIAVILALLFLGLNTELSSPIKALLAIAVFLIGFGLFIAIREKQK